MHFLATLSFDTINTFVAIAGVLSLLYGLIVYGRNREDVVSRAFFWFALAVGAWSISMVVYRSPGVGEWILPAAHMLYVAAALIPIAFIFFVRVFEADEMPTYYWYAAVLLPCLIMVGVAAYPNFLIRGVSYVVNGEPIIVFSPLIHLLYFAYIAIYGTAGLYILFRKFIDSSIERQRRLMYIIAGTFIPLSVSIVTNLLLPFFGNFDYNWVGQISTFGMMTVIMYGMLRHQIFDVRVITTELLLFVIWGVALGRVVFSDSLIEASINAIALAVLIGFGLLLIRSVYREIEQRELIQAQELELEAINRAQENLLHFISHEIKGYLTEGQNAFAAIVEGDFGTAPPKVREVAHTALTQMRRGVGTVMDILDASNLKKGTVSFRKESFDFKEAVRELVQELKPFASERGLALDLSVDGRASYDYAGDPEKLRRHVIRNLIDNAIRYTPKGSVHVTLARTRDTIVFSVKDSGVGITSEDMARLFTEGGRGKDSIKVNVHSTGYGLFIAKQIIEAHGGTIRAESSGAGKGSEFIVKLPVA